MNVDELIVRLRDNREQLRSVGGYDNGLVNVPAHGVRQIVEDAEQLCDAYEALAKSNAALVRVSHSTMKECEALRAKVEGLEKVARDLEVAANTVSYCYNKRPENFAVAMAEMYEAAAKVRDAVQPKVQP